MFDAIARRYDFLNHFLSAGIDRQWRREAVRSLQLTGRERVLDVCTGTGDLAIASRTANPGAAFVIGVDFARAMLCVGLDKLRRRGLADTVQLARGDATRLPLPDASVDAATIAFGIRNVDDPGAACRELNRVLGASGRLAILEFAVPTAQPFRSLYMTYFKFILPRLGRLVSGHDAAYRVPSRFGRDICVTRPVQGDARQRRLRCDFRTAADFWRGRSLYGAQALSGKGGRSGRASRLVYCLTT